MRFIKKFFYVFVLISYSLFAQSKNDFLAIVDKSIEKLYQNPDECIAYTQSVLINEQNVENRLVLQNVIAQAYAMKGDYVQSIRMSLDQISPTENTETNSSFALFYIDYALAEQYQNLQLYQQSELLINKILKQRNLSNKSPDFRITLAKVYQLQGINYWILKDPIKATNFYTKSNLALTLDTKENQIIKAENKLFETSILLKNRKDKEAQKQIELVLKDLNHQPNDVYLQALAHERLARVYFLENDYLEAIENLKIALNKIQEINYLPLKSKLYESLSKSYLASGNEVDYQVYQKLFSDSKLKLDLQEKEGIRYLIKLTESYEKRSVEVLEEKLDRKFYLGFSVIALVVVLIFFVVLYENKRKKEYQKQLNFLENFHLKSNDQTKKELKIEDDKVESKSKKSLIIPKETEVELLQKLEDFENSQRFLSKEMSLAVLSGQLETNTKYLSEVINKYKEKNFNVYINELRVNYLVSLLKNDSAYLNYKVSYLADVAGFSSHSSFTTVFKSITGMSPNTFIQQLIKANQS